MLTEQISNEDVLINGFPPILSDLIRTANIGNGGVCLYFMEYLPIKQRRDLQMLPETIVAEIKLKRKKIFFVLLYRHPDMTADEVEVYMNRLSKIYESIH